MQLPVSLLTFALLLLDSVLTPWKGRNSKISSPRAGSAAKIIFPEFAWGAGRYRRVNLHPPYFLANFSLLPKLGLKIGDGHHTNPATPALSRKGRIMIFKASPVHQHTTRRGPKPPYVCMRRFLWRERPTPGRVLPYISHIDMCRPKLGFLRRFRSEKLV